METDALTETLSSDEPSLPHCTFTLRIEPDTEVTPDSTLKKSAL